MEIKLNSSTIMLGLLGLFCLSAYAIPDQQHTPFKSITIDISGIDEGEYKYYLWKGVPIYVYRRSELDINNLLANNQSLVDSNSENQTKPINFLYYYRSIMEFDADWLNKPLRSIERNYFVLIGISPSRGCSLKHIYPNHKWPEGIQKPVNWHAGFFDPCDELFFDFAGRIYKNSIYTNNIYVPKHRFIDESTIELIW